MTGHEASGVLGFTTISRTVRPSMRNGVDMQFDWGASQSLPKQFRSALRATCTRKSGCDSGSGDRVGCFPSQVVGIGPQARRGAVNSTSLRERDTGAGVQYYALGCSILYTSHSGDPMRKHDLSQSREKAKRMEHVLVAIGRAMKENYDTSRSLPDGLADLVKKIEGPPSEG